MPKPPASNYTDIGDLGEDLVAQWLESTGWEILHRRFSCRWGEIDIIAQYHDQTATATTANHQNSILAFVEVKTRSAGSWDAGGRNAITLQKQVKLCSTAEKFLAQYPEKADYPCRFDVAIVFSQRLSKKLDGAIVTPESLASLSIAGYELTLLEYIPAAFDATIINE
ncbi:MAG: YraN family protein [Nostocales cyanobacterium]|nr:MAG: YraN family protein [Nostocales cyanobacterium]